MCYVVDSPIPPDMENTVSVYSLSVIVIKADMSINST
jgi:hypothetical protein